MEFRKIKYYNNIKHWSILVKNFTSKDILKLNKALALLGFKRDRITEKKSFYLGGKIKYNGILNEFYKKGKSSCTYLYDEKFQTISISWIDSKLNGDEFMSLYLSVIYSKKRQP